MTCLLLLFLSGGAAQAFAQKLIPFETEDFLMGYKDARGRVRIPARYRLAQKFSREGIAGVVDETGWAIIDRSGRILIRNPFIFDNGPDYFVEGLARVVGEGGKFGFFDKRGKIVIAPRFDFAAPFANGAAAVCVECRKTAPDANGHYSTVGGRWGFIDRRGAVIVPLKFETVENFARGRASVKLNGKAMRVDKRGRVFER